MALDEPARKRGITAVSAGNHAIAAAFAAHTIGVSAKILVLASANPVRVAATRAYGAEVILAKDSLDAFAYAEQLVREEGRTMIHPFEGPLTAQGTATVGLELIDQLPGVDAVVVAVGGGGLAGGLAAAVKALKPTCRVFGVEPEGADAMRRSIEAGKPVRLAAVNTIADSLAPPMTLPYSYELCRTHLDRIVTVSDDEICKAMAVMFYDAKLAVEPAGAATLAAAIGPLHEDIKGLNVALIVCGANIDPEHFCAYLSRGEALLFR